MRTINRWLVILGTMLLSATVHAERELAVLDVQAAIFNSNFAQQKLQAFSELRATVGTIKQLESLSEDYQKTVQELEKDAAIMSEEQQQTAAQSLQDKRNDIDRLGNQLQIAQQEVMQRVMIEIQPKVQEVVNELIASEKIGVLLDSKAALHFEKSYDVTDMVTEKLNKEAK
jgi:outer membrane protein